uniref:Uncharacterized protein n=1 Tax=Streptomyces sp. NBC_00093 TaxID=2975649 RepID=A0AAU2A363_9ACTN
MTAVGWDEEGDEACSGPCCPPEAPAEKRPRGFLTRMGITLRIARKDPPPRVHPHASGGGVLKAVVKDRGVFTVLFGMYGDDAQAVAEGAPATVDVTPAIALGVRALKVTIALAPTRGEVEQILERDFGPLPFTCPQCSRTSHHPKDKQYGYRGACHAYTGDPS